MAPMSPSRRYLYLVGLVILVPLAAQVAVWIAQAIEERGTARPVKAARAFLEAFGRGDCERALSLLSSAGRGVVEAEMAAQHRPPSVSVPRSCWTPAMRVFHGLRATSARLESQTNHTAIISLSQHAADPKSFLLPGFWPTRYIVTASEMHLAEEGGAWKVVLPPAVRPPSTR
jgi:hypothetical protein